MFEGYKVVCVTPGGRQRYLEILSSYILASDIVDEYHIWKNTNNVFDIDYMEHLAANEAKVRIVEPDTPPGKNIFTTIPQFFRHCIDERTIYVRLDDDIVYIEPQFFEKILQFRVNHPEYFLIFPNIVNNALCTYLHAQNGVIDPGGPIYPWCMDRTAWWNPRFAEQLHRAFLSSLVAGSLSDWYFQPRELAFAWFSINGMIWFGRDFASFDGKVTGNEEEFLTVNKPSELQRLNCIYGNAIISHFSFFTQRDHMDTTDILQQYHFLMKEKLHSIPGIRTSKAQGSSIWTPRLLSVISELAESSESNLKNSDYLADKIRYAGLVFDPRFSYGDDNQYMNAGYAGLSKIPLQLARVLIALSDYRIRTVIEIGTGSGWTTSIMTAYLLRFNRDLSVITADLGETFSAYEEVRSLLPIRFEPGKTARDFVTKEFDLVCIDGEHSYTNARHDYLAVGKKSPLCVLNNINDKFVRTFAGNHGGVPRLWSEIKSQKQEHEECLEFLDHSLHEQVMGMGLIVKAQP